IAREVAAYYLPDLIAAPKFDITGNWEFETDIAGQKGTPKFIFKQEGHRLSGRYLGQFGEAELSGIVDGDKIEFSFHSGVTNATYRGVVADKDGMSGLANYGQTGTWTGKRASGAASGQ